MHICTRLNAYTHTLTHTYIHTYIHTYADEYGALSPATCQCWSAYFPVADPKDAKNFQCAPKDMCSPTNPCGENTLCMGNYDSGGYQ